MTESKPKTRLSTLHDDELIEIATTNPAQLKETGSKILKALREEEEKSLRNYRY